jgi:hypothetical protein
LSRAEVQRSAVGVQALIAPEPFAGELVLTGPDSISYPQAAAVLFNAHIAVSAKMDR